MPKKLIIEHDRLKRELAFPFGICGDRNDITYLVEQLHEKLKDPDWCYGWVYIRPPYEGSAGPNTKPVPWRDADNGRGES